MDIVLIVLPLDLFKRLDIFVSEKTGITRSQVQRLMEDGQILVNSRTQRQSYKVKATDIIAVKESEKAQEMVMPEPVHIRSLYVDAHLVVVDKPAGMVVYPSAGHHSGTLVNALLYHYKKVASIGGPLRPGIVHRLDKDTSGVMVVALEDSAYYRLAEQFKNKTIIRRYKALVFGEIREDSGEITLDIGRSASDRKKMSTRTKKGKAALTHWRVVKRFKGATLIEARLGTGRTHQIRVHFAALGHPVLGDRTYGKKLVLEIKKTRISFPRQMLHAETLGFIHPISNTYMEFSSSVPADMAECIMKLESVNYPRLR